MIHIMCSVRDVKSEVFGRPFFTPSVGVAIRSFDDEVNRANADNVMHHHSQDFSLYQLGTFNDVDATFDAIMPKLLVTAEQVKKKEG